MQKHFSHVYKMLISPPIVPIHEGNFLKRYMKNRQTMKFCSKLWTGFNKEYLINQGVDLRRKLKQAVDEEDKVLLMKVCSIPLYERIKQSFKTVKLGSWGYHFEFQNIYKIQGGQQYLLQQNTFNPLIKSPEWIRVEFKFKEELDDRKLVDRTMWIERRIDYDNMPAEKKWYIYDVQY